MNKISAIVLFIWVAGWTLAAIRAGLKTRTLSDPMPARCEDSASRWSSDWNIF